MIFVPAKKGCLQHTKQRKKNFFIQIIVALETPSDKSNI
jgi:hypothetical protein